MSPSRHVRQVEVLHPDDTDERSTFLSSEPIHSPLSQEEEDEDHAREVSSWKTLPWWKRPSPYWLIFGIPLNSIAFSSLLAPRVALYTALACRVHRPEYVTDIHSLQHFGFPLTHNLVSISAAGLPIPQTSDGSETAVDIVSLYLPNSTYTASSYYTQNEPDSQQKCASDPVVQAVVARLNAVFNTSMGIISCFATGWWGSLSDRYGRRIVMLVAVFGAFMVEVIHVISAWFVDVLPGGYWFPLVGFLIDGLCGSMPTSMAVDHAYLADTTDPPTRSRYFSLALGLLFTGVAVGPLLGGLLIHSTGTILSVFYFAAVLRGVYGILILLVLPESLSRARVRGARLRRRQEKANEVSNGCAFGIAKSVTRFLSPLAVLLSEKSLDANPLKRQRRDWSLFFIAIAYGLATSILGSFSYKFQYAAAQFNWSPEITSYYVSSIGAVRAFYLTAILPLIIKYFKPAPIQLLSKPDEPLRGTIGPSSSHGASSLTGPVHTDASEHRLPTSRSPASFDLALARGSAVLESVAYLGMAAASTGILFTLASMIGSFAIGFPPTTQALALDIYTSRRPQNRGEAGKLFGALSVLQALGSQIISPALYGFVYSNTVATFPQAIMVVSMCTMLLAFTFVSLVRIPSEPAGDRVTPEHGNEDGSRDTETPEILIAIENEVIEG